MNRPEYEALVSVCINEYNVTMSKYFDALDGAGPDDVDMCQRFAIEAVIALVCERLRVPTEEMIEEAFASGLDEDVVGVWRDMLNASALNPGDESTEY